MSTAAWATWLTVAGVLIAAGVYRIRKYGRAEGGEVTPLADLMDGPEQLGDDTLAMVNGPAVVTEGHALVADLETWLGHLDVEAWLGERGWL
ncbi:MAG TPA: hypothetical protein VIP58_17050 [Nocardioides sp.]